MRVLVFEYINGGGFAGQPLPASLAAEGAAMLRALLDELKGLPDLRLVVPLDRRCRSFVLPADHEIVWVDSAESLFPLLTDLIGRCDAVWPIAPESEGILTRIARDVEAAGKTLLLSDVATVAICSDKLTTCRMLIEAGVSAVETVSLADAMSRPPFPRCVLKPIDGAGCEGSFVIDNAQDYAFAVKQVASIDHYIVQPYLDGDAISLSCLFKQGKAWLLSCNRQQIVVENGGFRLDGCLVNVENPLLAHYQDLIADVARVLPGLWGYVGIDLVESVRFGPKILEINPRLTTSYVGINPATGINVAEQVLRSLHDDPVIDACRELSFQVSLH